MFTRIANVVKRIASKAADFIRRHAPQLSIAMSVISTTTTVVTVVGLVALGQVPLALALVGWSVLCNVIALTTASQAIDAQVVDAQIFQFSSTGELASA